MITDTRSKIFFYIAQQKKARVRDIVEELKEKIIPILKKAHVKKAALFGSYVRGDNTIYSDVDILVDLHSGATLLDLVGIKQDPEEMLHKEVDVISYGGIDPLLNKSILSNQYALL